MCVCVIINHSEQFNQLLGLGYRVVGICLNLEELVKVFLGKAQELALFSFFLQLMSLGAEQLHHILQFGQLVRISLLKLLHQGHSRQLLESFFTLASHQLEFLLDQKH